MCFFDKNMLMKLWTKYNTPSNLPFKLSNEDLYKIQYELMDYLKMKIPFLETKVNINGVMTDFYSIRTKIHMADVRTIFKDFTYACYIAIAIALFSLFKIKQFENPFNAIKTAYHKIIIIFIIIISGLILFASVNFDLFFVKFHQMLFTNDFWLLDPNEDFIICLLPEIVFINIGMKITITLFIFILLFGLLCQTLSKIQPSPEAK